MAQVCVDPQGLVLVHADGTLAHEDCPCAGGGPCCAHGNYCNLPTPLMVECTASGVIDINNVIVQPYDVRQTFPISLFNCNGTGTGGSIPLSPNISGRFDIEIALSPVGGNYSTRPVPPQPYAVVAGAPFVRIPVIKATWNCTRTGSGPAGFMRFDYDFAQGSGWTGIETEVFLFNYTVEGSATAPSASEFLGRCPTRVSASGDCREIEQPGGFYQAFSCAMSVKLLNATGCGGESAPGLDPPPGVELPPGWRWTENGPVPNVGCGGCGG